MRPEGDAPSCDHGLARRWLEQPGPYGWRGWFCAAEVPEKEMCLPIFIGPAYPYTGSSGKTRRRLRWPRSS